MLVFLGFTRLGRYDIHLVKGALCLSSAPYCLRLNATADSVSTVVSTCLSSHSTYLQGLAGQLK